MKKLIVLCLILSACAGSKGDLGATGANGAAVTVVTFCPGTTPPPLSTFPVTGLCINNQVYGIYTSSTSFLGVLPVGSYNAASIDSACSFNILPDCVIQ